jgi:hypothetical protein
MQARQQAHYFKQGLIFLSYKSLPTRFDVFLSVGTLKNRSFTAFGVSRSEIGIAGRNVTVTPWSGCDEYGHHLCKVRGTQLTQDKPDDKM